MIFNPRVVYDHDGCQISNLKVSSPPISSTLELYTMFRGKSALETTSQRSAVLVDDGNVGECQCRLGHRDCKLV